jgi:hypothetical protein
VKQQKVEAIEEERGKAKHPLATCPQYTPRFINNNTVDYFNLLMQVLKAKGRYIAHFFFCYLPPILSCCDHFMH